jgi:hypothetical protein
MKRYFEGGGRVLVVVFSVGVVTEEVDISVGLKVVVGIVFSEVVVVL